MMSVLSSELWCPFLTSHEILIQVTEVELYSIQIHFKTDAAAVAVVDAKAPYYLLTAELHARASRARADHHR